MRVFPRALFLLLTLIAAQGAIADAQTLKLDVRDKAGQQTVSRSISRQTMTVDFKGDPELVSYYRNRGLDLPLTVETENSQTWRRSGGPEATDGTFLVRVNLDEVSSKMYINGSGPMKSESPLAAELGIVTVIRVSPNGIQEFVEFEGKELSDEEENTRRAAFEGVLANGSYPRRELKVGDTFTQQFENVFPIQNIGGIEYTMRFYYKLDSIESEIGIFSLTTTFELNDRDPNVKVRFEGSGSGMMRYNAETHLIEYSKQDIEYEIVFSSGDFSGRASSRASSEIRASVLQ